ncbi:hypothetical protein NA57DRAFT_32299 [Rhizodiscina lignyota]|uniref:3-hydroxyisobutyrate dehydrogenase n=1 Tax=Rhizodiscina lignyota TaxID=1504668 RepID=A0A9P4IK75_9PEZI|nr:hypothetical protein NA57DRAFT_32299 [Rhizodiscina lignyota]
MAKNLRAKLPKEDTLYIQDVNPAATEKFMSTGLDENVKVASNPREVAENAVCPILSMKRFEVIVTALPEPSHVKSVYGAILEPATLLKSSVGTPRLFIDTSTIDPITSRGVAKIVNETGQGAFIDAPMSGGVVGATAGTLTFMIGASPDLVPKAKEVLLMMGRRVLHMGEQGAGLSGKLANNYLLALNNVATAEAFNMGIRWGLDAKALAGMINTSTGKCWPSEINNPVPGVLEGAPAGKDYEGGFGIGLANKDLKLAIAAAKEVGIPVELGEHAQRIYDGAEAAEQCKGRDFSVVYRYIGGAGA